MEAEYSAEASAHNEDVYVKVICVRAAGSSAVGKLGKLGCNLHIGMICSDAWE